MGIMKRIATERTMHGKSLMRFAPGEREAIRSITRSSEELLKYLAAEAAPKPTAGGVATTPIWVGAIYCGDKPERAGTYIVVDTVTETRDVVCTMQVANLHWMVYRLGHSDPILLESFNRKTRHWFQLTDITPDDIKFIRTELP